MATVAFPDTDSQVNITFEKNKIISRSCSVPECKNKHWCKHVVAAVLFRIRNPEKVLNI